MSDLNPSEWVNILLVEDNPGDARLIQEVFKDGDLRAHVHLEADGQAALDYLAPKDHLPDIILTDLHMPKVTGLELVEKVRRLYPSIPVVLMTAFGNEEIAIQALQKGAVNYVPKKNLNDDLVGTLEQILEMARGMREQHRLLECLVRSDSYFSLGNNQALISPLINHLEENLRRMALCDPTGQIRVCVALREALDNAIKHGNLEMPSSLFEKNQGEFYRLAQQRLQELPYRDRHVHVSARQTRSEVVFTVRDEGPGFDPSILPDPTDPANLEKVTGRGLLLIRTFMDEVHFNESGNEITMVKRRDP